MKFETYWLIVPLVGIALCAIAALVLWWTRPRHCAQRGQQSMPAFAPHSTDADTFHSA
jgi:hypothetical protein